MMDGYCRWCGDNEGFEVVFVKMKHTFTTVGLCETCREIILDNVLRTLRLL